MTPTKCPHCNATTEWYSIPEAGLERCSNCFMGTREATTPAAKKSTPLTTKKDTPTTKADEPIKKITTTLPVPTTKKAADPR